MNKLSLILLSSPTIIGSILVNFLVDKPAQATELNEIKNQNIQNAPRAMTNCDRANCSGNSHLANFVNTFGKERNQNTKVEEFSNLETTEEGDLILEFTEEESTAAIELFGCDCVTSLNALRQLRGETMGVEGDIIPSNEKIKPCSQQSAPEIGS